MIDLEELKIYKIKDKINFQLEEHKLREQSLIDLQNYLKYITSKEYLDFKKKDITKFVQTKYNIKDFKKYHKNMELKINNFCKNWNINKNDLFNDLKTNTNLQRMFVIDFKKQNCYETMVYNYFLYLENELHLINNFQNLAIVGANSCYIYNGTIVYDKPNDTNHSESIDFSFSYSYKDIILNFYISHKYTDGYGSGQFYQGLDIEKFLSFGHKLKNKNNICIALCDGTYFTNYKRRFSNQINLQYLIDNFTTENTFITDSYGFGKLLCDIIINKLEQIENKDYLDNLELLKLNTLKNKYLTY